MRTAQLLALSLLSLFILVTSAHARLTFPMPSGWVVDDAKVLSPGNKQAIEKLITDHAKRASVQIILVTVPSLQGAPITFFTQELGSAWGAGSHGKGNSVLIVIAPAERDAWIEGGDNLKNALSPSTVKYIVDMVVKPQLQSGDSEAGIRDGVESLVNALTISGREVIPPRQVYGKMIAFGFIVLLMFTKIGMLGNHYFRRNYPELSAILTKYSLWSGVRGTAFFSAGFGTDGEIPNTFGGGGASGGW